MASALAVADPSWRLEEVREAGLPRAAIGAPRRAAAGALCALGIVSLVIVDYAGRGDGPRRSDPAVEPSAPRPAAEPAAILAPYRPDALAPAPLDSLIPFAPGGAAEPRLSRLEAPWPCPGEAMVVNEDRRRLALGKSLTGLFEYGDAPNDSLRSVKLVQRYEFWLLKTWGQLRREASRVTTALEADPSQPSRNRLMDTIVMANGQTYKTEHRVEQEAVDPLVLDLDGDGVRASTRWVRFDLDGDGFEDRLRDVSASDGVLAFDADRDGVAGENAREIFGNHTDLDGDGRPDRYADSFAALQAFAAKAVSDGALPAGATADGRLDAGELAALEARYGFKVRLGGLRGRAVSLREAGVAAIQLPDGPAELFRDFDGQSSDVLRRRGAAFLRADGSVGSYEGIWFRASLGRLRPVVHGAGTRQWNG